jgi:4-hydroxybenzoate polyprenyltransferase
MSALVKLYRLFNLLSLDVVIGAIVCALFFARVFQVEVRLYGLIALGITVWLIYTVDHLRDARNIHGPASTERHRFHQLHYRQLIAVAAVALIVDIIMILFIRQQVLEWGIALSLIVFAYLIVQSYLMFLKEMFIAVLYTCGVLLLSVPVSTVQLDTSHYLLIAQFALTAFTNLIMFSWFDRDLDQQDKSHSFVTISGEKITRNVIWFLMCLLFALLLLQLIDGLSFPSLIIGIMDVILMAIFIFRRTLARDDHYRLFGDAVFFLPVVYLFNA